MSPNSHPTTPSPLTPPGPRPPPSQSLHEPNASQPTPATTKVASTTPESPPSSSPTIPSLPTAPPSTSQTPQPHALMQHQNINLCNMPPLTTHRHYTHSVLSGTSRTLQLRLHDIVKIHPTDWTAADPFGHTLLTRHHQDSHQTKPVAPGTAPRCFMHARTRYTQGHASDTPTVDKNREKHQCYTATRHNQHPPRGSRFLHGGRRTSAATSHLSSNWAANPNNASLASGPSPPSTDPHP